MRELIKEKPVNINYPTKEEALRTLFEKCNPTTKVEIIPLSEANGRVLAGTMYSLNTLPVVRASMMDGIAVKSKLFKDGTPDTSNWTVGEEYCRADTGDDFDDKYDAVIAIEKVTFDEQGKLHFNEDLIVNEGDKVKKSGSMIKKDDYIISDGVKIRPYDMAALAIGGITEVPVYKKPVVAFIPTGSELIPAGTVPQRGQNIDANSIMVKHMLIEMGAEPICYPIVKDNLQDIEMSLEKALSEADVIIINGGSSKGEEDYTIRVINKKGEVFLHGVAAGPGRPMGMAVIDGKPVINLPGPAIGAYHGLDWCIREVVNWYLGLPKSKKQKVKATLSEDMPSPKTMSFLCKLNLEKNEAGDYIAIPVSFRSASIGMCLSTNAQLISEIGEGDYKKGDSIEVELLRGEEFIL